MTGRSRREFLADVGRGMLIAGLGSGLAAELGLATVDAAEGPDHLTFGALEPLVSLMQETPPDKLQQLLVERIASGTELKQLVAAGALANARAFGGEDYVGFHTMMALMPAYHMANELPSDRRPLPVLKVLYRNAKRIQEVGGPKAEALKPVEAGELPQGKSASEVILDAIHKKDRDVAERTFAAAAKGKPEDAFNQLLVAVQDACDVHRVVLPWRAWALLDVVGSEHAHTMLRQSVRYCVKNEGDWTRKVYAGARAALPKLLDQYKLPGKGLGSRKVDDAWIDKMTDTLFKANAEQAADAAAAALGEGIDPAAIAEAISLAANQLVLRDAGRPQGQTSPGKPVGSVHGDSIGVHACDSANAWRNMSRVANPRNATACLILSAWQVAHDRVERGGDFLTWKPRPWAEHRETIKAKEPAAILKEAEEAIRANDQARAVAAVAAYGEAGGESRSVFDLLLRYAVSEEGALHAEKYYRTTSEEFALTRPAFRWRQLLALARVTASEFGQSAAGYADACKLLKV